jgi:hypothetical protein
MTDFAISHETLEELRTKAILEMAEGMKALEQQLAAANQRIAYLESQVYGGTTK